VRRHREHHHRLNSTVQRGGERLIGAFAVMIRQVAEQGDEAVKVPKKPVRTEKCA
jgi:hypothetical protein